MEHEDPVCFRITGGGLGQSISQTISGNCFFFGRNTKARCSILASVLPKNTYYQRPVCTRIGGRVLPFCTIPPRNTPRDDSQVHCRATLPLHKNCELTPPIMSRFDLFFILQVVAFVFDRVAFKSWLFTP